MSTAARVAAQAKINLRLRVLEREADGYHQIETVFLRLALADQIEIRITEGARTLEVTGANTGPTEKNLAMRAAVAYADATGWPSGFSIKVEKHIPIGAGLGGGSADAGAVLRALNALAPRRVPDVKLYALAVSLGADVPFLTTEKPCVYARGRGEQLSFLSALPPRHVVLVQPGFAVATADAYGWIDAARRAATRDHSAAILGRTDLPRLESWDTIAPFAENDFESVIFERHPQMSVIVAALRRAGASIARMTGSGSTIFGIFESGRDVERLASARLPGTLILTSTAQQVAPVERIHA